MIKLEKNIYLYSRASLKIDGKNTTFFYDLVFKMTSHQQQTSAQSGNDDIPPPSFICEDPRAYCGVCGGYVGDAYCKNPDCGSRYYPDFCDAEINFQKWFCAISSVLQPESSGSSSNPQIGCEAGQSDSSSNPLVGCQAGPSDSLTIHQVGSQS